ncbi:hypothetical protein Aduo_012029 [Ancylostoma duodenale]
MFEQTTSDHSSDGSYVEMAQPVYTVPDGYTYALPAYETELGEEIDLVEHQDDYSGYSMAGTSTGYEVVDSGTIDRSQPIVVQQAGSVPSRVLSAAAVPEYSIDRPSTSKVQQSTSRVSSVKRPVFPVGANQVYRKVPMEIQQEVVYVSVRKFYR